MKLLTAIIDFDPATATGRAPSPCIGVCRMHPQTGWCEGCWRTLDEIAQWSGAAEEDRRRIWVEIRRRRDPAR